MKKFQTRSLLYILLGSAWMFSNSISSYAAPLSSTNSLPMQDTVMVGTQPDAEATALPGADTSQKPSSLTATRIRKCTATSNSCIRLTWDKIPYAGRYEIYRAKSKKGEYKCIASTKKPRYIDKTGKVFTTYYYKVKAVSGDPGAYSDSHYSKIVSATVRKKAKKIAYVGDSIMTGFKNYGVIKGKNNREFAKIGIHTYNFYTSNYMKNLLQYNPDRMIIMLGMNSLGGNPGKTQIDSILNPYKKILNACHKKNPNIEIIVMGVSPTRNSSEVNNTAIRRFNKYLKKYAQSKPYIHYFDTVSFLSDKSGSLKASYSGGDGIHWSKAGYEVTYKKLKSFLKEW